MRGSRNTGRNLFLIELMMSIFFFAIIAAVCTQIFSDSYRLSGVSQRLTNETNIASNIAEYCGNWDGKNSSLRSFFESEGKDGDFVITYDKSGEIKSGGEYTAKVEVDNSDEYVTFKVAVGETLKYENESSEELSKRDDWYFMTVDTLIKSADYDGE